MPTPKTQQPDMMAGLRALLEQIGLNQTSAIRESNAPRFQKAPQGPRGLDAWYANNPDFKPGEADAVGYRRIADRTKMEQTQRDTAQSDAYNAFMQSKQQGFDIRRSEAEKRGQIWTPQGLVPNAANVQGGIVSSQPAVNPMTDPKIGQTWDVPPMPSPKQPQGQVTYPEMKDSTPQPQTQFPKSLADMVASAQQRMAPQQQQAQPGWVGSEAGPSRDSAPEQPQGDFSALPPTPAQVQSANDYLGIPSQLMTVFNRPYEPMPVYQGVGGFPAPPPTMMQAYENMQGKGVGTYQGVGQLPEKPMTAYVPPPLPETPPVKHVSQVAPPYPQSVNPVQNNMANVVPYVNSFYDQENYPNGLLGPYDPPQRISSGQGAQGDRDWQQMPEFPFREVGPVQPMQTQHPIVTLLQLLARSATNTTI